MNHYFSSGTYTVTFLCCVCIWPSGFPAQSNGQRLESWWLDVICTNSIHLSSFYVLIIKWNRGRNSKCHIFMLDEGGFCSEPAQWEVSWVEGEPSATSVLIFTVKCTPSYINIIYTWILNKRRPCLLNGDSGRDRGVASHMIQKGFSFAVKLSFLWKMQLSFICKEM